MFLPLFVCLFALCNCQGPGAEVNYVLHIDSPIYAFGEASQEFMDTSQIYVERYNESISYLHGFIVFKQRLENNAILDIVVLKEASGKFEVLFSHTVCDFCNELGDESSDYHKHFKYLELPTECPIEPGSYKINDLRFDVDDLELSSSHVGRYEAQLNFCIQTGESCQQDRDCKCLLKMDLMVEEELA